MSESPASRDAITVVIVGAGIQGLVLADVLSRYCRVIVVGQKEVHGPITDSQRNHAWLQSGLLYLDLVEVARALAVSGRALASEYGLSPMHTIGLFGFPSDRTDLTNELIVAAETLGYGNIVREVPPVEARGLLGAVFDVDYRYFRVPDRPFDEGYLMQRARRNALANGTEFRYFSGGVMITAKNDRAVVVDPDQAAIKADFVISTAGRGTPALLESLGAVESVPVRVYRSGLMKVQDRAMPRCDLFVDRKTGLTIVQHGRYAVVGDRNRVPQLGDPEYGITDDERVALVDSLPALLRKRWVNDSLLEKATFTGGMKTEATKIENGIVKPSVAPLIADSTSHGVSNLLVVLPGKATMANYVAHDVRMKLGLSKLHRYARTSADGPVDHPPTDPHFSELYKDYDDSK